MPTLHTHTESLTSQPIVYLSPSKPLVVANTDLTAFGPTGLTLFDVYHNFRDIVADEQGVTVLLSPSAADYALAEHYTIESPYFLYTNSIQSDSYYLSRSGDTPVFSTAEDSCNVLIEDSTLSIRFGDETLTLQFENISSYDFVLKDPPTIPGEYTAFTYELSGDMFLLSTAITSISSQYYVARSGTDLVLVSALSSSCLFTFGYDVTATDYINDNGATLGRYYKDLGGNRNTHNASIQCLDQTYGYRHVLLNVDLASVSSEEASAKFDFLSLDTYHDLRGHNIENRPLIRQYRSIASSDNDRQFALGVDCEYTSIECLPDVTGSIRIGHDVTPGNINDTGFRTGNAVFANSPEFADRIYSPLALTKPASASSDAHYLCTWLFGSEEESPMWLDRWYDPQGTTSSSAYPQISAGPWIVDAESSVYIQPGTYLYFHQGQKSTRGLIDSISEQVVCVTAWSPARDEVGDNLVTTSKSQAVVSPLLLDGNTYAQIEPSEDTLQEYDFTLAFWAHTDRWGDIKGSQIAGNYFLGGYGVFCNNGVDDPSMITLVDYTFGHTLSLNDGGKKVFEKQLGSATSGVSSDFVVVTDTDSVTWIFDNTSKVINAIDVNNLVVASITATSAISFDSADVNSENVVYFLCESLSAVYSVAVGETTITAVTSAPGNLLYIDRLDGIHTAQGTPKTRVQLDKQNNEYLLRGSNVYKNNEIIFHLDGSARGLAIDNEDNLWVSYNRGFVKIDTNGTILASRQFPSNINSSHVEITMTESVVGTRIWFVINHTDVVIEVDSAGNIVRCHSMDLHVNKDIYGYDRLSLFRSNVRGDLTGYYASLKYALPLDTNGRQTTSHAVTTKFKTSNLCGGNIETHKLHVDADRLQGGWHQFVFVFNSYKGYARMYVDGKLMSQESFAPKSLKIHYQYKTPFMVGSNAGRLKPLLVENRLENSTLFTGMIDGLRIYSKSLTADELRALYWEKMQFSKAQFSLQAVKRNAVDLVKRIHKAKTQLTTSPFFDLVIVNGPSSTTVRSLIEARIRNNVQEYIPANCVLRNIKWH